MITPRLVTWVEERHDFVHQGIMGFGGAALELVATPAREAEVVKRSCSALRLGDNVVNRHRLFSVGFCSQMTNQPISGQIDLFEEEKAPKCVSNCPSEARSG